MSYEMSGQHTTYPYPPPAATVTVTPKRSRFSKWWPLSFFLAAVLFFIIGGALLGTWAASTASDCYDTYYSGSSYKSSYNKSCSAAADGKFWGGVACVVLGGICKLIFWILLIVWCVKRSSSHAVTTAYAYQPVNYAAAPPPTAPAAPAPLYQNAPQYQNQPYNAHPYQNAPPYQSSPSPAPYSKEGPGVTHTGY
ncbi:hypothetical protein N657DRAFT_657078 [Parathielavia appendiculata]|uniref:Uncharacterized protein n=1 Tax=Parathielavia appendiculata TaxID=2587402 RepID=A0AAN6Z1T1_9PEZI|nr:hypothetical protein N657DRAFT_657078 [Parathielavia appendiculata]